jgi:integrase
MAMGSDQTTPNPAPRHSYRDRKHLTQAVVDKLRPDPAKRIERPDHLYPALRLVVQPSGARSFAVRARINDKHAKITLGQEIGLDLAAARDATKGMLADIAAGKDPRAVRQRIKATTFEGVAQLYLKHVESQTRPKTHHERVRHLTRDWAPLGKKPIAEIRRGDVAARLLEIKDGHGAVTANRARSTLNAMFEWAIDQELIEVNIVASTRRPLKRETPRDRVLTPAERREILAATEDASAYSAAVRLLLFTLQRREEVADMRHSELDKALWSLPASRTKNSKAHIVPLSRQALEIIKAQPDRGEYVFGLAAFGGWSRCKARLDRRILEARLKVDPKAKPMPPWVLHDLRRTGATAMNDELGIAPHVVEATINHQSGAAKRGVAGTYNRASYIKERAIALQRWADHLSAESASNVVAFPAT